MGCPLVPSQYKTLLALTGTCNVYCPGAHFIRISYPTMTTTVYIVLVTIIAFAMLQWITNGMSGMSPTFVGFIIAEYVFE